MTLYDFLTAPCPICLSVSFRYICTVMDEYTNILMHDQFITGAGIFIDTKQHTAHLLGSIRKIHIIKFCRNEHYKASIKNIIPYQFENENRIAVPDHVTYEELKIRVKGCYGAT